MPRLGALQILALSTLAGSSAAHEPHRQRQSGQPADGSHDNPRVAPVEQHEENSGGSSKCQSGDAGKPATGAVLLDRQHDGGSPSLAPVPARYKAFAAIPIVAT